MSYRTWKGHGKVRALALTLKEYLAQSAALVEPRAPSRPAGLIVVQNGLGRPRWMSSLSSEEVLPAPPSDGAWCSEMNTP